MCTIDTASKQQNGISELQNTFYNQNGTRYWQPSKEKSF